MSPKILGPNPVYTKTWERPALNPISLLGNIVLGLLVLAGIGLLSYLVFDPQTAWLFLAHGGPESTGDYAPYVNSDVRLSYVALIIWTVIGSSMFLVGVGFNYVLAPWTRWRGAYVPDEEYSETTYECGETPIGEGHAQTNLQYYSFAIVFVIFDVITSFVLMFALVFKGASSSPLILLAFAVFSALPLAVLGLWVHKKAILWQ